MSRLLLPLLLISFGISSATHLARASDDREYNQLFGAYLEVDAVSQIKPKVGEVGGLGGHVLVYVHGLCKDYSVAFPKVIPCSQVKDSPYPHRGVGISVNSQFENVNWVAVPGYDFTLRGELPESARLDQGEVTRTLDKAAALKVYDGVLMHPTTIPRSDDPRAYQRLVAEYSMGTDFALSYGRIVNSLRVPIDESILPEMAEMLNARNTRYLGKKEKFAWSGLTNNCAHLTSCMLEVAGIRHAIPQELPFYRQIFNLAVPANGVLTARTETNFKDLDALTIWAGNSKLKETVLKENRFPLGGGILSREIPVVADNDFFQTKVRRIVLAPTPLAQSAVICRNHLLSVNRAEYRELGANLGFWQTKLKNAIGSSDPSRCMGNRECIDFFARYKSLLERKLADTAEKIEKLKRLEERE